MARHQARIPEGASFRPTSARLLDQVREVMRHYHYSLASERSYIHWVVRFIKFHGTRHPRMLGKEHIESFLSYLAVEGKCSASTQNQAFNALVFLYRHVLLDDFPEGVKPLRSSKSRRIPVVLSQNEVRALLECVNPGHVLMAQVMYGAGLRLMECLRLRVQDIDFENSFLVVRHGKGGKDRTTLLPHALHKPLQHQLSKARLLYEEDKRNGQANVWLPDALDKKMPHASRSWNWQWVFPSKKPSVDPRTGKTGRHHVHESALQKAIRQAARKAGINKRVTTHTLRHSFATHLLQQGTNIRVLQKLLGHADVKTTEIYTHVLQENLQAVCSPLDQLETI